MQYEVIPTPKFERDLKKLGRKDKGIGNDIKPVLEKLEEGDFQGDVIPMRLKDNNNMFIKIRIASTSRKIGKSGAYRLICYAEREDGKIYLLTIYPKNEKENIKNKEILELILKYCM